MPLTADLQASFTSDGFSLDVSVSGLGTLLDGVVPLPVDFDASATGDITTLLESIDLDSLGDLVAPMAAQLVAVVPGLPDLSQLIGPLQAALDAVELATSGDLGRLLARIEAGVEDVPPIGLAGLQRSMGGLAGLGADPTLRSLLDLVGSFVPVDLTAPGTLLGGAAGGLVSLVQLLTGLMMVEAASAEIERMATLAQGMLAMGEVSALLDRLRSTSGPGLVGLLAGLDPDDPDVVEVLGGPVTTYVDTVRTLVDTLLRGLAFGEATIVHAGFSGLALRLDAGTVLLDERALPPVRDLATTVQGWLGPALNLPLPAPNPFDSVWGQVAALVTPVVEAIDAVDPSALGRPLRQGLDAVVAPLRAVQAAATEVATLVHAAFAPLHTVLDAVDLRPVQTALNAILGPVTEAVAALADLVAGAQAAIESGADAVLSAITPVRDALSAVATTVHDAFQGLADAVTALGLPALQAALRDGVAAVTDALHAAQLRPVFDVAVGIIDTSADLLGAVPKAMLPDDLRQELEAACAPVEALDLEPIRSELRAELEGIVAALDTDVLAELEAAFAEVLAFLDTIDPAPALEAFEHESFDTLVDRLREIDPTVALADVMKVLDDVKAAVAAFDPRALLAPLESALDDVSAAIAGLDPATLLGPVDTQLAAFRTWTADTLQIAAWRDRLEGVDAFVAAAVDRLDPARLVVDLDAAWSSVVDGVRGQGEGVSVFGTLLAALGGPEVHAGSLVEVLAWIRGERDGAVVVRERLRRAGAALSATVTDVRSVDLQAVVGELDTGHRAILGALTAYPDGSLLRVQLERSVRLASPLGLLGGAVGQQGRYVAALLDAQSIVTVLGPSDRAEVHQVAEGLRLAAQPLEVVPRKLREVLAVVGLDPEHLSLRDALADALERLPPSRLLEPLVVVLDAVRAKLAALAHDGVIGPLQDAVDALQGAIDAIDLGFLGDEVRSVRDAIVAKVDALRPTTLLGEVLDSFDAAQATLAAFDPFGPVRAVVEALQAAIGTLAEDFRPTVLLAPVLQLYRDLRDALGTLDVSTLLEPVLDALSGIAGQLEDGMDAVIDALAHLQDACESDGPSIPDIGISVDIGL